MSESQQPTLLVVEDDVHLLQGIRDILEIEGYRVLMASSGVEGLETLKSLPTPPDLIISDIMMPRMDGYQFFEAVRANEEWVDIPFVFLTAKGEKHDVRLGKQLGAEDYVVKPMDPEDLLVIVEARLKRHKQIRALYDGEISDLKRQILTILNHEFRTPLTYMVAYADMLNTDAENLTSQELRMFLRGVNSGAERFRRLVENFITLVELETGEGKQNFETRVSLITDLEPLLKEVKSLCAVQAEDKGIEILIEIPQEVPAFKADYEYLKNAIMQLVENGIKFTDEPGKRVVLRVTVDEDHVYFSVQDWGRGIEPRYFEEIWQPFTQIKREQYEDQGAGSGLAIVKGVADLHGGEVRLESEFGKGSTFTIVLPRK